MCAYYMSFIKAKPKDQARPEVLQNWELLLKDFKLLRLKLKDFGFKKFATIRIHLKIFLVKFGSMGSRITNPSIAAFVHYYKSLLIYNFTKYYSKLANCEANEFNTLLVKLRIICFNTYG